MRGRVLGTCLFLGTATLLALACDDSTTTEPIVTADGGLDAVSGNDGASGGSPQIRKISWTHAVNCSPGVRSNVALAIDAIDSDTAAASLTFSGQVTGCTSESMTPADIDMAMETLSCPEAAPYQGTVTVTDAEGHSATRTFTIRVCTDGSVP